MIIQDNKNIPIIVSDSNDEMKFAYGAVKMNTTPYSGYEVVLPTNCHEFYKKTHFDFNLDFSKTTATMFQNEYYCLFHHCLIKQDNKNYFFNESLKNHYTSAQTVNYTNYYFEQMGCDEVIFQSNPILNQNNSNIIHAGMIFKTKIQSPTFVALFIKGSSNKDAVFGTLTTINSANNYDNCKLLKQDNEWSYYALTGCNVNTELSNKYYSNPLLCISGQYDYDYVTTGNTQILDHYLGFSDESKLDLIKTISQNPEFFND